MMKYLSTKIFFMFSDCFQIPGSGGSGRSEHVEELQRSVESYLARAHDNINMAGIYEVSNTRYTSTLCCDQINCL